MINHHNHHLKKYLNHALSATGVRCIRQTVQTVFLRYINDLHLLNLILVSPKFHKLEFSFYPNFIKHNPLFSPKLLLTEALLLNNYRYNILIIRSIIFTFLWIMSIFIHLNNIHFINTILINIKTITFE